MTQKKYYVEIFDFLCPLCMRLSILNKAYYSVFEKGEIAAAKYAGLITYHCTSCDQPIKTSRSLSRVTKGVVIESCKHKALAHGLDYESKGRA